MRSRIVAFFFVAQWHVDFESRQFFERPVLKNVPKFIGGLQKIFLYTQEPKEFTERILCRNYEFYQSYSQNTPLQMNIFGTTSFSTTLVCKYSCPTFTLTQFKGVLKLNLLLDFKNIFENFGFSLVSQH